MGERRLVPHIFNLVFRRNLVIAINFTSYLHYKRGKITGTHSKRTWVGSCRSDRYESKVALGNTWFCPAYVPLQ